MRWRMARSPSRPTSRRAARHFAQQPELEPHRASGGLTHSRLSLSFRCADPTRATMSSDAIDYVKKPAMEFIRDSWRLVKRCTKPDRTGASPRERRTMRAACSSRTAAHQLRPQLELAAAHQTGRRGTRETGRAHGTHSQPALPPRRKPGQRPFRCAGRRVLAAVAIISLFRGSQAERSHPLPLAQSSPRSRRRRRWALRSWASSASS